MTKSLVGSGGIESLITLHGVLCAFLVSIALGNEPLVAPAAFHRIVAWRWSKHGLKETTMASGDEANREL